jgi:hypothetical protein
VNALLDLQVTAAYCNPQRIAGQHQRVQGRFHLLLRQV